jgi:transcriptional regulator with PAS, ATPase and Fis domain
MTKDGEKRVKRKRAEEAFEEREKLLRLVLATLPVGVAVTDRVGDIVHANAASKLSWGDTIVSGRQRWAQSKASWHDTGKSISPTEWASVKALSEGKTSLNELIDIETYDGQRKIIQNSAAPIRNAGGLIVGAVIVNENVTERVRAESALRESTNRLQHLVGGLERAACAPRRHQQSRQRAIRMRLCAAVLPDPKRNPRRCESGAGSIVTNLLTCDKKHKCKPLLHQLATSTSRELIN